MAMTWPYGSLNFDMVEYSYFAYESERKYKQFYAKAESAQNDDIRINLTSSFCSADSALA